MKQDIKKLYNDLKKINKEEKKKRVKDFFDWALKFIIIGSPSIMCWYGAIKILSVPNPSSSWIPIFLAIPFILTGIIWLGFTWLICILDDIYDLLKKRFEVEDG